MTTLSSPRPKAIQLPARRYDRAARLAHHVAFHGGKIIFYPPDRAKIMQCVGADDYAELLRAIDDLAALGIAQTRLIGAAEIVELTGGAR